MNGKKGGEEKSAGFTTLCKNNVHQPWEEGQAKTGFSVNKTAISASGEPNNLLTAEKEAIHANLEPSTFLFLLSSSSSSSAFLNFFLERVRGEGRGRGGGSR